MAQLNYRKNEAKIIGNLDRETKTPALRDWQITEINQEIQKQRYKPRTRVRHYG